MPLARKVLGDSVVNKSSLPQWICEERLYDETGRRLKEMHFG